MDTGARLALDNCLEYNGRALPAPWICPRIDERDRFRVANVPAAVVTLICSTMYRIHPAYLLWVLDGLLEGQVINEITVPEDVRRESLIALERMLSLP